MVLAVHGPISSDNFWASDSTVARPVVISVKMPRDSLLSLRRTMRNSSLVPFGLNRTRAIVESIMDTPLIRREATATLAGKWPDNPALGPSMALAEVALVPAEPSGFGAAGAAPSTSNLP